jgi:hypothetical protein
MLVIDKYIASRLRLLRQRQRLSIEPNLFVYLLEQPHPNGYPYFRTKILVPVLLGEKKLPPLPLRSSQIVMANLLVKFS